MLTSIFFQQQQQQLKQHLDQQVVMVMFLTLPSPESTGIEPLTQSKSHSPKALSRLSPESLVSIEGGGSSPIIQWSGQPDLSLNKLLRLIPLVNHKSRMSHKCLKSNRSHAI